MERITCSLANTCVLQQEREVRAFHGVWQLWMADMMHLMEFMVQAEPLDCFVPSWVPVPRCSWLDQHLGPQELPLSFAGEPALVLRSSSVAL